MNWIIWSARCWPFVASWELWMEFWTQRPSSRAPPRRPTLKSHRVVIALISTHAKIIVVVNHRIPATSSLFHTLYRGTLISLHDIDNTHVYEYISAQMHVQDILYGNKLKYFCEIKWIRNHRRKTKFCWIVIPRYDWNVFMNYPIVAMTKVPFPISTKFSILNKWQSWWSSIVSKEVLLANFTKTISSRKYTYLFTKILRFDSNSKIIFRDLHKVLFYEKALFKNFVKFDYTKSTFRVLYGTLSSKKGILLYIF